MRRANLVCGAVLLMLAAAALVEAARLKDDWQGARLMPAVLAAALALLAAGHLRPSPTGAASVTPDWPDAAGRRRIAAVLGALIVYVALLEPLGFLLSTALCVLCLVRLLGAWSWMTSVGLTVAIAVACHVVFKQWLGMPLP